MVPYFDRDTLTHTNVVTFTRFHFFRRLSPLDCHCVSWFVLSVIHVLVIHWSGQLGEQTVSKVVKNQKETD